MEDWRQPLFAIAQALKDSLTNDISEDVIVDEAESFIRLIQEGDYDRIDSGDLPANQYATIKTRDGIPTLVFDPENIPKEVLFEASGEFTEAHKITNGFALEDRGPIAEATKTEGSGGVIDKTYHFYKDIIPQRFLPVLRNALVLRVASRNQSISRGRVYDWRGEIAGSHQEHGHDPQEAHNLISLCSSGYLDEERFFYTLYQERVLQGQLTVDEYKRIFDEFVRELPFTVFVQTFAMSANDVFSMAENRAYQLDKYQEAPEYVEVCGRGERAYTIIDDSLDIFQKEYPGWKYEGEARLDESQYILRITPQF